MNMLGKAQAEKVFIPTSRGKIESKYYKAPTFTSAVILLGGCEGGWWNPTQGSMYPELCSKLNQIGISALHLKYRYGGELEECTHDVLEALKYLKKEGILKAGIVGWSFGGAVVCQGAGKSDTGLVKAVATLATQSAGVSPIRNAKGVASLFIHGNEDTCLDKRCSEYTYKLAHEPKRLMIVSDHHGFFDTTHEVQEGVINWFKKYIL